MLSELLHLEEQLQEMCVVEVSAAWIKMALADDAVASTM